MSLCTRCGMNEPLPNDPDDFCSDCALEAELLITELEERRRREDYFRMEFACVGVCECGGNPACPRCNP